MKLVFTAPNSLMVDHLKLVLDNAGIDSVVEHRHLSSAAGLIPAQETWPELWIFDDADEAAARGLIEESTGGDDTRRHLCLACGEALAEPYSTCWHCGAEDGSLIRPSSFQSEEDERLPRRGLSASVVQWVAIVTAAAVALTMLTMYGRP